MYADSVRTDVLYVRRYPYTADIAAAEISLAANADNRIRYLRIVKRST